MASEIVTGICQSSCGLKLMRSFICNVKKNYSWKNLPLFNLNAWETNECWWVNGLSIEAEMEMIACFYLNLIKFMGNIKKKKTYSKAYHNKTLNSNLLYWKKNFCFCLWALNQAFNIKKNNFYLKLCRKDLHSRRHWRYFIRRFQFGSFFDKRYFLCFNFSEQFFFCTKPDRKIIFVVFNDYCFFIINFAFLLIMFRWCCFFNASCFFFKVWLSLIHKRRISKWKEKKKKEEKKRS